MKGLHHLMILFTLLVGVQGRLKSYSDTHALIIGPSGKHRILQSYFPETMQGNFHKFLGKQIKAYVPEKELEGTKVK